MPGIDTRFPRTAILLAALLLARGSGSRAGETQPPSRDLTHLSLEELLQIEVTSVARKEQKLSQAAAAVYVINQEDIQRSGLTSIPELLRMVPGLQVAQIDSSVWAITSRGFNGRFASKMLVLIDGRSVYTPLFSGVYWDMHDMLLEDIERIEVIRGPGATMWGVNAVNGVINVITKHARDTQGGLVVAGGGTVEQAFGAARFGGKVGSKAYYRIYSKHFRRDHFLTRDGQDAVDDWRGTRGGFRFDWDVSRDDSLTVEGSMYGSRVHQVNGYPIIDFPFRRLDYETYNRSAGDLSSRWRHIFPKGSEVEFQFYYDHFNRPEPQGGERRDTVDFQLQHRIPAGSLHELSWGLGYRYSFDQTSPHPYAYLSPGSRGIQLYSAFLQDEIELAENELLLTAGSKFEHDDFSGFHVQPTARLLWAPDGRHSGWLSISRAVRTPSRGEHDATIRVAAIPASPATMGLPVWVTLLPSRGFQAETLTATEIGYRILPAKAVSLDLTGYYNAYRNLRKASFGAPFFVPSEAYLQIPAYFTNELEASAYGGEAEVKWDAASFLRLSAGYTWIVLKAQPKDGTIAAQSLQAPRNQVNARAYVDLPHRFKFDTLVHFTGVLPDASSQMFSSPRIPSFLRLDARLGWTATPNVDLSLSWQNLLDDRHPEFSPELFIRPSEVRRGLYGKVTWHF